MLLQIYIIQTAFVLELLSNLFLLCFVMFFSLFVHHDTRANSNLCTYIIVLSTILVNIYCMSLSERKIISEETRFFVLYIL